MEGSASGNVQEVPQMGAESRMKIEEPKVGDTFASYFTKQFEQLGLSDAEWTDLGVWKLTEEEKGKAIDKKWSTAPYDITAREKLLKILMDNVQKIEAEESDTKWVDRQGKTYEELKWKDKPPHDDIVSEAAMKAVVADAKQSL